jgi:hypothetical protein
MLVSSSPAGSVQDVLGMVRRSSGRVSGIMRVFPVSCPLSVEAALWCVVVLTASSAAAMRLIRLQRCQEFQQVT